MPRNNQISAPLGSYIPRNANAEAIWFRDLTDDVRTPMDPEGFALRQTAYSIPHTMQDAFVQMGLLQRVRSENRLYFRYRITPAGRAALRDFEESKTMAPREADNFLRYRALERLSPEAA